MGRFDLLLGVSVRAFLMEMIIKSVNFEASRLPSLTWVGLLQTGEGLNRTETDQPQEGGDSPADGFRLFQMGSSPESPGW